MAGYKTVSSDDHVFEPADLWTSRIEPKYRDRAPHLFHREEDNTDWWTCEGIKGASGGSGGELAGARFEDPEKLRFGGAFEDVRLGGYIPEEHIKDMDIDGVDVSIVYPTVGLMMYSVKDGEMLNSVFSTYNDWVAEFCQASPDRLKAVGMLNLDDVQVGIREMERCAKMGLVGAMISVYPIENRPYDSPEYEPLWAAAQDLQMPLSLHISTNRAGPDDPFLDAEEVGAAAYTNVDHWVRMSLAHMIFSGVFERYPKLQVGSVEMEVSWVPHFLDRLDYNYTQRPKTGNWHTFQEDMMPSDYFHRNVFLVFLEDHLGIKDRHIIGVDNLLWGSDYPHIEGTFPNSQQILEEILAGCTDEEKAKMVGGNAERVYGLN